MQIPLRQTRNGHRTIVLNGDVHHVGGYYGSVDAWSPFSVERWSFQFDHLEYVETVTLNINNNGNKLIPMSRYLKRFLNSTTFELPNFGKKSIEAQEPTTNFTYSGV